MRRHLGFLPSRSEASPPILQKRGRILRERARELKPPPQKKRGRKREREKRERERERERERARECILACSLSSPLMNRNCFSLLAHSPLLSQMFICSLALLSSHELIAHSPLLSRTFVVRTLACSPLLSRTDDVRILSLS